MKCGTRGTPRNELPKIHSLAESNQGNMVRRGREGEKAHHDSQRKQWSERIQTRTSNHREENYQYQLAIPITKAYKGK